MTSAARKPLLQSEDASLWPKYYGPRGVRTVLAPERWQDWLPGLFPRYVVHGFAPRHVAFWQWLWAIDEETDPRPFVGIWPRAGAKSTSAELGTAALGLRGRRRYALYVRDTQERADDSVQNIASLLESSAVDRYHPEHAKRLTGKWGDSRGWRRNRLRTEGGFTVDALGLDTAARGVKLEEHRPDLIIFDDVDGRHDTPHATEKKLTTIKESILPAGTDRVAVIAIQNLITPHGVFSKLVDGTADCLSRRILSGPEPAVVGLQTERRVNPETKEPHDVIVGGTPTWVGQDLNACQRLIDRFGLRSFKRECQHEVKDRPGALWTQALIDRNRVLQAPRLKRIIIGVDPSGGANEIGIVAMGEGYDGHGYVLADRTQKGEKGPRAWGRAAVDLYHELEADLIAAEGNFGGDMVRANILVADPKVPVRIVHASRGKDIRAQPIASLSEEGKIHHVGHHPELEAELTGWVPGDPESPNRLDAKVWAGSELFIRHSKSDEASRSYSQSSFN